MRASLRPLTLAAVLAGAALACCYASMILQGTLHTGAPALAPALLGTAPLFYLLFTRRIPPREALGPRAFPATALITVVAAPIFAGLAHFALALPIVKAATSRDGDSVAAVEVFVGAMFASIVLVSAAAAWLVADQRRRVGALLALAAPAALVAELALVAAGLASPRPAPSGYLSALPVVGKTPASAPATGEDLTEIGDVTVKRRCANGLPCDVWLTRRGEAVPPGTIPDFRVNDPLLLVRRDAARDLWIVDGTGGAERLFVDNEPERRAAYGGADAARVVVRPATLAGGLAPPRGWIAAAALGAVIAARRLLRRRTAKRALGEILAAEPGSLDAGGWITLDRGGAPLRAPAGIAPGPVLVVPPRATASSAYRTDAAPTAERVLAGTRADRIEEVRHSLATIDARALAAVIITAAPLATAWLEGLR